MKKYILIEADHNDGDYTLAKNEITEERLELFKPIIEKIKENRGDFSTRDCGDSAQELYGDMEGFEQFLDFCPNGEGYGIHTIESVDVITIAEEVSLL